MHFGRSAEVHCREYLYHLLCIELLSNILHILQSDFLLNFYLLANKSAKCSCELSVSGSRRSISFHWPPTTNNNRYFFHLIKNAVFLPTPYDDNSVGQLSLKYSSLFAQPFRFYIVFHNTIFHPRVHFHNS